MENRFRNESSKTPDWVYRVGLFAVSLLSVTAGTVAIRNFSMDKLTAAGAEAVPYVGMAFIAAGILGILTSVSKNRQGPKP